MCFLNENKTEAFLLRVLIEVGRRATTNSKQRVCNLHVCSSLCSFVYAQNQNAFSSWQHHLTQDLYQNSNQKYNKILTNEVASSID